MLEDWKKKGCAVRRRRTEGGIWWKILHPNEKKAVWGNTAPLWDFNVHRTLLSTAAPLSASEWLADFLISNLLLFGRTSRFTIKLCNVTLTQIFLSQQSKTDNTKDDYSTSKESKWGPVWAVPGKGTTVWLQSICTVRHRSKEFGFRFDLCRLLHNNNWMMGHNVQM